MKSVASRDNAAYKAMAKLAASGSERRRSGESILDGAHLLAAFLDSRRKPEEVMVDAAGLADPEVAALVERSAPARVTLLSDGTPLMNSSLAKEGNAALALGLLDIHPDVVWLVPPVIAPASSGAGTSSVTSLLPSRLRWAFLQLVIAVIVIALWRGRRLGRLVPEELPVVVRQAETVRGRSRLYRRSQSLNTAANALREGTRDRLGRRLGLGPRPQPAALVQAVASRTQEPAAQVQALLYGAMPADDGALVTLAQSLTALEQEVLRT